MDGAISLPAQLDQLDKFKALFEHLSSILPLRMREKFATDKNRINQTTKKLLCELARARDLTF